MKTATDLHHLTECPTFEVPAELLGLAWGNFAQAIHAKPELVENLRVEFGKIQNPEDWRYPIRVCFSLDGDQTQVLFCDNIMRWFFGMMPKWEVSDQVALVGEYAAW